MAYSPYQSERRFTLRRRLLIALSLTVIVVLIMFLASRQTDQRGTVAFFGAAEEATVLQESAAQSFSLALSSIGVASRQDLTRRLESVVDQTVEAENTISAVEKVPSDIGAVYGTMRTASASWTKGGKELERVIVGIMDGEIVEKAVPELEHALELFAVGDAAYELFTATVEESSDLVQDVSFPSIRFIDPSEADPFRFNPTNLVLRIQGAYGLAPHHDVSVQGATDPAAIGNRDGWPVVPFSDSIAITALVTNVGNEPEVDVDVALKVVNVKTNEVVSRSQVIPALDVGSSTTVSFDAIEVQPGGLYQANLTVSIDGDIDLTNDNWTMTFLWNAES